MTNTYLDSKRDDLVVLPVLVIVPKTLVLTMSEDIHHVIANDTEVGLFRLIEDGTPRPLTDDEWKRTERYFKP